MLRARIGEAVAVPVYALALALLDSGPAEAPTGPAPVTAPVAVPVDAVAVAGVAPPPPLSVPVPVPVPVPGSGPARAPAAPVAAPTGTAPDQPKPPTPVPGREGEPVWLEVPGLGVAAPVDPMGVDPTGRLDVPDDPGRVGWWADGALLPDTPQVLVGHVDSRSSLGVFARLGEVDVGDQVTVTDGDGSRSTYAVTGLRQVPKDAFPTEDVYGPGPSLSSSS